MLTSVEFLSVEEARRRRPRPDTLLVSILDLGERERHRGPALGGWRSVLSLDFEDTAEEVNGAEPGSWPDEPTAQEHAVFCHDATERAPTLADARKIVEFLAGYHALPQQLHLVVHCRAGQSRSAAVAVWVAGRLGVPRLDPELSTHLANRRVIRLLEKAWAQHEAELARAAD